MGSTAATAPDLKEIGPYYYMRLVALSTTPGDGDHYRIELEGERIRKIHLCIRTN